MFHSKGNSVRFSALRVIFTEERSRTARHSTNSFYMARLTLHGGMEEMAGEMIVRPKNVLAQCCVTSEKLLRYRQDGRALFQPEHPRTAIALLRCVSRKVRCAERITISHLPSTASADVRVGGIPPGDRYGGNG